MPVLDQVAIEYLRAEGIDRLIDFNAKGPEFVPEPADLARIHRLVRTRKSLTVLELGVGYSTIVIADALRKNRREWEALPAPPKLRNRFMFHCFSVDASKSWLETSQSRFPAELRSFVTFHFSPVKIGTHNGQLCHFYENVPDVIPDFLYLDGPDPADVQGSINGLTFQCPERTVMSGDPLLMESTLLPGFFMLIDGRTNNARFLQRNLTRQYKVTWDREGDVTMFELDEERLGYVNILGRDILGET
jgi:hypothetical protein